jgi:indolepyruvate ferredoxin oxidoreductase
VSRVIEDRCARLKEYGSAPYARRYIDLVQLVRATEEKVSPGELLFTHAVAFNFYKLLAIKDEYEVARLLTRSPFLSEIERSFEGRTRIHFHLLASRNVRTGARSKRVFGSWVRPILRTLAALRCLRETKWDPFRLSAERRLERRLRDQYEQLIPELCRDLQPALLPIAVQLASLPDRIRGFGYVKAASIREAESEKARLLRQWAQVRAV